MIQTKTKKDKPQNLFHQTIDKLRSETLSKPRPILYSSGPMMGCTPEQMFGWRKHLETTYPEFTWFNPTRHTQLEKDPIKNAAKLVALDLADLDEVDGTICNLWQRSTGSICEMFYSFRIARKITVVVTSFQDDIWIRQNCHLCTDSMSVAMEYLKEKLLK